MRLKFGLIIPTKPNQGDCFRKNTDFRNVCCIQCENEDYSDFQIPNRLFKNDYLCLRLSAIISEYNLKNFHL